MKKETFWIDLQRKIDAEWEAGKSKEDLHLLLNKEILNHYKSVKVVLSIFTRKYLLLISYIEGLNNEEKVIVAIDDLPRRLPPELKINLNGEKKQ